MLLPNNCTYCIVILLTNILKDDKRDINTPDAKDATKAPKWKKGAGAIIPYSDSSELAGI